MTLSFPMTVGACSVMERLSAFFTGPVPRQLLGQPLFGPALHGCHGRRSTSSSVAAASQHAAAFAGPAARAAAHQQASPAARLRRWHRECLAIAPHTFRGQHPAMQFAVANSEASSSGASEKHTQQHRLQHLNVALMRRATAHLLCLCACSALCSCFVRRAQPVCVPYHSFVACDAGS